MFKSSYVFLAVIMTLLVPHVSQAQAIDFITDSPDATGTKPVSGPTVTGIPHTMSTGTTGNFKGSLASSPSETKTVLDFYNGLVQVGNNGNLIPASAPSSTTVPSVMSGPKTLSRRR